MKKITKTIACAVLAAAISTGTAYGAAVYAADTSYVNESVSSGEALSFGYDLCRAWAADSEGNVYYIGSGNSTKSEQTVFKADRNNNIIAKADLGITQWANPDIRLSGDKLVIRYNDFSGFFSIGDTKCRVYDTELSEYKEYSESKWNNEKIFDADDSHAVWYRRNKLYICSHSSGDVKALADLTDTFPEQVKIKGVAVNNKYAAFSAEGEKSDYIGYVDIKTGELTVKAKKNVYAPKAYENAILWCSDAVSDDISSGNRKFSGTGKIYSLTDEGLDTCSTESGIESMPVMNVIDSDGRLITMESSSKKYGENKVCFRVYEDNKVVGRYFCENPFADRQGEGFVSFTANGGKIAVNRCGTSDGNNDSLKWVKVEDEEAAAAWIEAHSSNVITRTVIIDY